MTMKILVVDDKKENLYLLERMIKKIGYEVVVADNGKQALVKLYGADFKMVISDILMPVMDGFQLCRAVRSDEKFNDLLFVFYTATYVEKEDEEFALKLGADKFLRKPLEPEKFIGIIKDIILKTEFNQIKPSRIIVKEEQEILKLYNERLIHKLEQKVFALEKNIIESKMIEEELSKTKLRLEHLLSSSPAVIYACEPRGDYQTTFMSKNVKEILGYEAQEFINNSDFWENTLHPEDRQQAVTAFHKISEKDYYSQTYRFQHKNGTYSWLLEEANLGRDDQGNSLEIIGYWTDITELKKTEKALQKKTHDLGERIKELNCLYGISKLLEGPWRSKKEIFPQILSLIPPGWQYPEITCARIVFDGKEYTDVKFRQTPWKQVADIIVSGKQVGILEVYYLTEMPEIDEGPFLKEERYLLDTIVKTIGEYVEHKRSREALIRSEGKYRTILENIEEGYFEVDLAGNFTFFNDSLCRILGYSKAEMLGMNNRQYMGDKTTKNVYQVFNEVFQTRKRNMGFDWEIIRKNGIKRFIETSVALITSSTDNPVGFRGVVRDITERERADEALREKAVILDAMSDGLLVFDLDGRVISTNQAYLDIFGLELKDVEGKNFMEIPGIEKQKPEEVEKFIPFIEEAIEKHTISPKDVIVLGQDNEEISVSVIGGTLKDIKGNVTHIITVIRDITERKKAEDAVRRARNSLAQKVEERTRDLREEKQRIETVVETYPNAILVLDHTGSLYLTNKAFKDLYQRGLQKEFPSDFNIYDPSDNSLINEINRLLTIEPSHKEKQETEIHTMEPIKGLYLEVNLTNITTPGERLGGLGVIIELRDVTKFIEFDNLRKQFVSTVSHELRTPITAIDLSITNLKELEESLSTEEKDQLIEMIAQSSSLLNQMIEDLLIISRIEAGRIKLQPTTYKLWEVLNALVTQLDSKGQVKQLTIQADVPPEIELFGDPMRIGQIFRILLDNAIKYSPEQSTIKINAIDHYQGDYNPTGVNGSLIQVSDTGLGISEEDLPHIFERFFRADMVREIEGTGLGLSIAKELVLLHQGEIYVESELAKGSTFSVFFPVNQNMDEKKHDKTQVDEESYEKS